MILYGPTQSENRKPPKKTQLLHVDLVDKEGKLTIIVNMVNGIFSKFFNFFTLGNIVFISNFAIPKKGKCDRGNVKYSIHLQH